MTENRNPFETNKSSTAITEARNRRILWLEAGFWLLAIVLGFVHTWADHHYLTSADAMSYLDIAEAYLRRDWHMAVSAYWSPLYSWLIALALFLVKPSSYWKFSVLHLVNFAIYLFALGCFGFLIRELFRRNRSLRPELLESGLAILPGWALVALGYPLFIWSTLYLIFVSEESPDLLVASFVYLACAIVLRIRRQDSNWIYFMLLGLILGLGYLAKSVMLPMAFIFLGVAMFSVGGWRRTVPRISLAVVVFLLVVGPFVFAISRAKGRLTFGESGRLNYLWAINRVPTPHWQGEPPGYGKPMHSTRRIFAAPPIYEFGYPVGGTYPVWYDPTYWYEGSVNHFDFRRQLNALGIAVQSYYELFHKWGLQYALLVGLLSLYLMGQRGRLLLYDLTAQWSLIIPAVAGIGLYSLVNVQGRYVASFFVLFWLALFSAVRLPNTSESQRLIKSVTIVLMAVMTFTSVASSSNEAARTTRSLIAGEDRSTHKHWQVAEGMRAIGMSPGDKVAVIGNSARAFWAHLAGLRIIAELRDENAASFWEADSTLKNEILETFKRTGAKVIVTENPPAGTDLSGWQRIGETDCYFYLFKS